MKKEIHPPYHEKITATCSCGHSFGVGSTAEDLQVEVCSNCHPFYTGTQKLVDTAGRVDKFKKRLSQVQETRRKRKTAQSGRKKSTGTAVVSLNKAR